MPIVLFIVVFIVYLSFYLHDYCKIQGVTDIALYKAAMNIKHEADIGSGKVEYDKINKGLISQIFNHSDTNERKIEDYIYMQLSKGLISSRISDVHVTKGLFKLSVRVEANFIFPLEGLRWIIALDNTLIVEGQSDYHYPANSVRISEVILDTGSKIKGFNKIKEGIEKLIPQ